MAQPPPTLGVCIWQGWGACAHSPETSLSLNFLKPQTVSAAMGLLEMVSHPACPKQSLVSSPITVRGLQAKGKINMGQTH